jgi:hypothetical protein
MPARVTDRVGFVNSLVADLQANRLRRSSAEKTWAGRGIALAVIERITLYVRPIGVELSHGQPDGEDPQVARLREEVLAAPGEHARHAERVSPHLERANSPLPRCGRYVVLSRGQVAELFRTNWRRGANK